MIDELKQEIAKLKRKLRNVHSQLLEEREDASRREHEHDYNWWYETDGSPDTEPCPPHEDDSSYESYASCIDCGCLMGGDDPYCLQCCDD